MSSCRRDWLSSLTRITVEVTSGGFMTWPPEDVPPGFSWSQIASIGATFTRRGYTNWIMDDSSVVGDHLFVASTECCSPAGCPNNLLEISMDNTAAYEDGSWTVIKTPLTGPDLDPTTTFGTGGVTLLISPDFDVDPDTGLALNVCNGKYQIFVGAVTHSFGHNSGIITGIAPEDLIGVHTLDLSDDLDTSHGWPDGVSGQTGSSGCSFTITFE